MVNVNGQTVPFLTRFFRAWADDIKVPDKASPGLERTGNDLSEPGNSDRH
jgi:hypothetical protein